MTENTNKLRCTHCEGIFFENDIFYAAEDQIFCQRCICKTNLSGFISPYMMTEQGDGLAIIDNKGTMDELDRGLYAISTDYANLVITDTYHGGHADEERLNWVLKKLLGNSMILEKHALGIILRFPRAYDKNSFNPDTGIAERLFKLIDNDIDRKPPQVLCRGDKVEGIACARLLKTKADWFITCKDGYEIVDVSYFRERAGRSPLAKTIAEKLEKIKPLDMLKYFEQRLIGQGKEIKKIVYTFYDYFAHVAAGRRFTAANWLLTAPSGCGKTEVFRILRDFCMDYDIPVPVVQIDLSLYTEAGFKGADVDDIIEDIMDKCKESDGVAVCFLDEADKKCLPSYSGKGDNVNAALQSNLLTLVEGRQFSQKNQTFDTSKTMFVFMGAFQNLRDEKQKNKEMEDDFAEQYGINICSDNVAGGLYDDITIEDIMECGMLEELAGRLTKVVNLHRLPEKDMRMLLSDKAKLIADSLEIEVELTDEAIDSLLGISYTNLGIRRPMSRINALANDVLSEYYFDDDFDKSEHKIVIESAEKASVIKKPKEKKLEFSA